MLKYLFILTIIYIISYLDIFKNKIKFIHFFSITIVLTLFAGLRSNTPDYSNYREVYNRVPYAINKIPDVVNEFQIEYGYIFFNTIGKNIYDNFEVFVLLLSFVHVILILRSLKKLSSFPLVSLMVYFSYLFINLQMAQIRNGLALGIIMNAIVIIKKSNFLHYSIYIIIASFFHISSIMFLPLYFLKYVKFSKIKSFFILSLILISSTINFRVILIKLIEVLNYNSVFINKFHFYLNNNYFPDSDFSIRLFIGFLITLVAVIYSNKLRFEMKNYDILIGILFCYLFFRVLGLNSSVFIRIANLFIFSQVIFLSSFFILFKNMFSKFIYMNLLYLYSTLSLISLLKSHPGFLNYNLIKFFKF